MNKRTRISFNTAACTLLFGLGMLLPTLAAAHCDTLDGPVVADARAALAKGDVTPVLKWVKADAEQEVRALFAQALKVRKLDPVAQELADHYFFETLVRVHRAGEGAPYTGLKPAGSVEPPIAMADQALAKGNVDDLAKKIASHTEAGIRERFQKALATQKHAGESVSAGREFVEAYVTYVHYVEGIVNAVHKAPHHGEETPATGGHQH